MEDDAIVDRLTAVAHRPWTVEMLSCSGSAPDVLPADDYGVRKGSAAFRKRTLPSRPTSRSTRALAAVSHRRELYLCGGRPGQG